MEQRAYQNIRDLIEANPSVAEFASFGDGVDEEWITNAELALAFSLPDSYKWWLRNFGGGEVGGEEVFSIYGPDFDQVCGGDLVYMYRLWLDDGGIDSEQVPILQSDIDGLFCFELVEGLSGNEYPILWLATGKVYAKNFIEFLEKRIRLFI